MLEEYLQELRKISLLEPEEERCLWQAYKDRGDMESRSRLIEQYQPLVFRETMRWNMRKDVLPDALQEGTIGLIEAVERFDYRRNVACSLLAVHRIRGRFANYLNTEGHRTALSMDAPDENGMTLGDILPDGGENIEELTDRKLLYERVAQTLKRIPEKEQLVLESVYLQDRQQKHVAQEMDLSLTYVYRLQKRGIRRVRGMLSRFIHDCRENK